MLAVGAALASLVLPGSVRGQGRPSYELPADQRTGAVREIFVLSHSHLDIGFTRPPDEVPRDYKDSIDTAIRLTREHPDYRWTIESAWMLEEWLRRTDDAALVRELGDMLREGRMGLGVAFGNMHSGLMAAEESNRLVYLGHKFRRRFGVEAPVAFQNDVPGFTWAFPRVLQGSGVRYLVTGLNLFIGGGNSLGLGSNPFYWTGPDGSRVLTWFTYDGYMEGYHWGLGRGNAPEHLDRTVPRRLAWLERNGYEYDTYLLMASMGDNTDPLDSLAVLLDIREWNRRHPELPMRMATADEFFARLTARHGDDFPVASGTATGHWTTVKLRVPETAGRMRRASSALPAAEAAATVASVIHGASYPRFDLAEAWTDLLTFQEHTTGSGPWPGYMTRWEADWNESWQYVFSLRGHSNAEQQFRKALDRLAAPERTPGPAGVLMVYNGLSWRRDGLVVVGGLPAELHDGPLVATDLATRERFPCEDVPGTSRRVVFHARDVPSVGYRLYRIEAAGGQSPAARPAFRMKAEWSDSGVLTSILDSESGRELLLPEPDRPFGSLHVALRRQPYFEADIGPAAVRVTDGPLTRRVEFTREGSALPLTVLTTYRDAGYADLSFDLDLRVLREETADHQAYAIALPLAAGGLVLDGPGFVARIPQDVLPGGESPQYPAQHFAHLPRAGGWGVTLANVDGFLLHPDMLFLLEWEDLTVTTREEGVQRLFRGEPRSTPVQRFRFRLAAQSDSPAEWKRMGSEANLPLRARFVQAADIPQVREFFRLSHSGVRLLAFKPAEFQRGWHALRLQEIAGEAASAVQLTTPLPIVEARAANMVEEFTGAGFDLAGFSMEPWETKTVLVRMGEANP